MASCAVSRLFCAINKIMWFKIKDEQVELRILTKPNAKQTKLVKTDYISRCMQSRMRARQIMVKPNFSARK